MASEQDVLNRIQSLVDEERELRARTEGGPAHERARLQALEVQLDQCWDLLRQRRALREAGLDPDDAKVRPADEVEGYLS